MIPADLAAARAAVLDPHRVDLHPALMQDAWALLKEARGQRLQRLHLLAPAHLVGAAPPPAADSGFADTIGAACARVVHYVRGRRAAEAAAGGRPPDAA